MTASLSYSQFFADSYHKMPPKAQDLIQLMLDRLATEHLLPHMRNMVRVADTTLYATPRYKMLDGDYRILWQYASDHKLSIVCMTLADANRTYS